jgi:hypothetical protein
MSNLDISTIEVDMAREHSPLIPKERFRPAPAAASVASGGAGIQTDWNFIFILFQV